MGGFRFYVQRVLLASVVLGLWYIGYFWTAFLFIGLLFYVTEKPYELLLVAVLIDIRFMTEYSVWPKYLILVTLLLIGFRFVYPYLDKRF